MSFFFFMNKTFSIFNSFLIFLFFKLICRNGSLRQRHSHHHEEKNKKILSVPPPTKKEYILLEFHANSMYIGNIELLSQNIHFIQNCNITGSKCLNIFRLRLLYLLFLGQLLRTFIVYLFVWRKGGRGKCRKCSGIFQKYMSI